jgi:hypothetical protein
MCAADKILDLDLDPQNIKSVRNSQDMTLILNRICQYDDKHILTSPMKTIISVMKISTNIIMCVCIQWSRTDKHVDFWSIVGLYAFYVDISCKIGQDKTMNILSFLNIVETDKTKID